MRDLPESEWMSQRVSCSLRDREDPSSTDGRPGCRTRRGGGGFAGRQMGQPVQELSPQERKDKVTVKTDAGDSYDITVTDTSRIMRNGQPIKLSDMKPGDSVTARGTVTQPGRLWKP